MSSSLLQQSAQQSTVPCESTCKSQHDDKKFQLAYELAASSRSDSTVSGTPLPPVVSGSRQQFSGYYNTLDLHFLLCFADFRHLSPSLWESHRLLPSLTSLFLALLRVASRLEVLILLSHLYKLRPYSKVAGFRKVCSSTALRSVTSSRRLWSYSRPSLDFKVVYRMEG